MAGTPPTTGPQPGNGSGLDLNPLYLAIGQLDACSRLFRDGKNDVTAETIATSSNELSGWASELLAFLNRLTSENEQLRRQQSISLWNLPAETETRSDGAMWVRTTVFVQEHLAERFRELVAIAERTTDKRKDDSVTRVVHRLFSARLSDEHDRCVAIAEPAAQTA